MDIIFSILNKRSMVYELYGLSDEEVRVVDKGLV